MDKIFKNRTDAAQQLARRLEKMNLSGAVVLAVPRGGVPVGFEIAKTLQLPLDVFLSKKIGHPDNPEFAIGSVTLESSVLGSRAEYVDPEYLEEQTAAIRRQLRERYRRFRGGRQPLELQGKTVILVDDGVATGNTLFAAIDDIRRKNPAKIIVAIAVAPPEAARKLSQRADELVCLLVADDFYAVGQFYEDFSTVEDEEVTALLRNLDKQATEKGGK